MSVWSGGCLGFVPTMGCLHDGHLSLIDLARRECDQVIISIFVNPTQFGPNDDFAVYPRDLAKDIDLIKSVFQSTESNPPILFHPDAAEIFPVDFSTYVVPQNIENSEFLEGHARPGHFRGVCTVLSKFFNIVQPDKAYFGQKDALQCAVVSKFVRDLNIPLEVVIGETVREADGLAMSSRNRYLSEQERYIACVIPNALRSVVDTYDKGERDVLKLKEVVKRLIVSNSSLKLEYVSIASSLTGKEVLEGKLSDSFEFIISLAVRNGSARLIDNVILPTPAFPRRFKSLV